MTIYIFKCSCCDKSFKSEKAKRAHIAYKSKTAVFHRASCIKCRKDFTVNNCKSHEATCWGTDSPIWNKGKTAEQNPELAKSIRAGGRGLANKLAETGELPAFAKYWQTPEKRKEKSEWRKKLHKETPESHPNRKLAGNRSKMSYPERLVFDALTEAGVEFQHNKKIDKYFPDFVIGNQIIEIDGTQWHDVEYDSKRDARLLELGYKVERFPVGKQKDLVERVKTFLGI